MAVIMTLLLTTSLFSLSVVFINLVRNPQLIKKRPNRQVVYLRILLWVAAIGGALASPLSSNWLIFVFCFALSLIGYFILAFLKLSKSEEEDNHLVVRPVVAGLLVVVTGFQLLTFVLAGSEFNTVVMGNMDELVASFWLWSGSIITAVFIAGCNLLVILESRNLGRGVTNTLDEKGLYLKFAFYYTTF